jgi:hypothetical protein
MSSGWVWAGICLAEGGVSGQRILLDCPVVVAEVAVGLVATWVGASSEEIGLEAETDFIFEFEVGGCESWIWIGGKFWDVCIWSCLS